MRRILKYCFICALCLFILSPSRTVRRRLPCYDAMIGMYEMSRFAKAEEDGAARESVERALYYSDVKMTDKYRIERILSEVENRPGTGFSAKVKNVFASSFTNGETMSEEEFLSSVRELYDELAGDDQAPERTPRKVTDAPDLTLPEFVLCPRISGDTAISSDGTEWIFSDKYFISFSDGQPRIIVRSPEGMIKIEGFADVTSVCASRLLFESTKCYKTEMTVLDGVLALFTVTSDGKDYGSLRYVAAEGLSSPLMYDFSSFTKNRSELY